MTTRDLFDTPDSRRWDVEHARQWQESRDKDALEAILRRASGVLDAVAWTFTKGHGGEFEFEDLRSVATLGAIRAVTEFDEEKSPSVRAWIVISAKWQIRRHIRDTRINNVRPAASMDDDRFEVKLAEMLGEVDVEFERIEDRETAAALAAVIHQELDDRDLDLLHASYVDERSQRDIAREIGYSQMHACRLIRWAADKARAAAAQFA